MPPEPRIEKVAPISRIVPTCGARTKKGTACGRPAGWGTDHGPRDGKPGAGACKLHGGSTPSHEAAAALELARREAVVMGVPIDDRDPWTWLKRCIAIAGGELEYATAMVATLTLEEAVGPVVTTHTRPRKYFGGSEIADDDQDRDDDDDREATPVEDRVGWVTEIRRGAPELHIWIKVRAAAVDRCAHLAAMAIKAGLAEREVRIAEQAGELMASLIRNVLSELGVSLEDPKTREVVVRNLRLIEGGPATTVPPAAAATFDRWGRRP